MKRWFYIPEPVDVYYGRSTNTTLNSTQIQALTHARLRRVAGTYDFASGSGYLYFATSSLPTSIEAEGFAVAMADSALGYTLGTNPMAYTTTVVNGRTFYVFRTYFILLGSLTYTVA